MLVLDTAERLRHLLQTDPAFKSPNMNQQCKVCNEPAAGFHFGAFTCEGCKSFFGRTYNNLSSISECKNNGECVINKKNRTSCKACRLRKCLMVGMSKSGSRYGRRSNWFKIHCLLQEQQSNNNNNNNKGSEILSKEDLKLFDGYSKSPPLSSPESDTSSLEEMRRSAGLLGPLYARHPDLPLLPLMLPHPAFLPPPPFHHPHYAFHKSAAPYQLDDNFNRRYLLEAVLSSPLSTGVVGSPLHHTQQAHTRHHEDAPIDLSLKSPKSEYVHSEEDEPEDEEEEEDEISVDDDFRDDHHGRRSTGHPGAAGSPPPMAAELLRRTTPLDLTTKVV